MCSTSQPTIIIIYPVQICNFLSLYFRHLRLSCINEGRLFFAVNLAHDRSKRRLENRMTVQTEINRHDFCKRNERSTKETTQRRAGLPVRKRNGENGLTKSKQEDFYTFICTQLLNNIPKILTVLIKYYFSSILRSENDMIFAHPFRMCCYICFRHLVTFPFCNISLNNFIV